MRKNGKWENLLIMIRYLHLKSSYFSDTLRAHAIYRAAKHRPLLFSKIVHLETAILPPNCRKNYQGDTEKWQNVDNRYTAKHSFALETF